MKDSIIKYIVAGLGIIALVLAIVIFATAGKTGEKNSSEKTDAPTESSETESPSENTPAPTDVKTPENKGPLSGLTVCLDPGHQKEQMTDKEDLAPWDKTQKQKVSSGTEGKFTHNNEYEINLQVALKIRDALTKEGANVVMVRETNDVKLSNIDRAKIGNDCNADVVLRIHCNGSDNPAVSGTEMWVRGNGDNSNECKERSTYDKALATELLDVLCETTGTKKRNVNTSDSYTGLNWSTVPSIIIELGFMSNETDDKNLGDPAYQEKVAVGIANWLKTSTVLKRG